VAAFRSLIAAGSPCFPPCDGAKIAAGQDVVVLDARPFAEYSAVTLPGSVDLPGPELTFRSGDLVTSPDTQVVVHCAGRTRGIVGAQTLLNAGLPNPVAVLENGIAGWRQAGLTPVEAAGTRPGAPGRQALDQARASAERLAKRFPVPAIDEAHLARMRAEASERSLFLLDVRLPEEYEAGHLPGAVSAPGGQLVQKLDEYVGVRAGRVVLTDDGDGIRATVTASWLVQLGIETYVLLSDPAHAVEIGPEPARVPGLRDDIELVSSRGLLRVIEAGEVTVLDVSPSRDYAAGHVPTAWWAVRARLVNRHANLPGTGAIVLVSPDGLDAQLAAGDLGDVSGRRILVLDGGTAAWRRHGLDLERGTTSLTDEIDDFWAPPSDLATYESWFPEYVEWGQALAGKIQRDATLEFRRFD
jgi:rhodanese-related sulfurtransferase